jgi:hypothetical protein
MVIILIILLSNIAVLTGASLSIKSSDEQDDNFKEETYSANAASNCAVFITGAGAGTDLLADEANIGANFFRSKGYNTKVITYYNSLFPLLSSKDAITNWIPENLGENSQVFIYIGAHSDPLSTLVIGYIGRIPPISLKQWINTMESKCNPSVVTVVIESCQSGRFISTLSGENRIVITSTDTIHFAYYNPYEGFVHFSTPFFEALQTGKSYGAAWEYADLKVDTRSNATIQLQDPKINDGLSTVGSPFPDTLTPRTRLALRVYPTRISKSKPMDFTNDINEILERLPALKLLMERFFQIKNKMEVE